MFRFFGEIAETGFKSAIVGVEFIGKRLLKELQIGRIEILSGRPLLPSLPLVRALI